MRRKMSRSILYFGGVACALGVLLTFRPLWGLETERLTETSDEVSTDIAEEVFVEGVVDYLGVFKNGVVVVNERFHVPSSGRYSVIAPPSAIHGTLFVRSDALVEATLSDTEVDVPSSGEQIDWATDFRGQWLNVVLPGEEKARTVRVVQGERYKAESDASARTQDYLLSSSYRDRLMFSGSRSVLLETEDGETIWLADSSQLTSVVVKGNAPAVVTRKRPRLIVDVKAADPLQDVTFFLSYLTRQVSWAPQYNILMKDDDNLELEQSAILINDWRDFVKAPTFLYSGFPQIAFQNALSPMTPGVSLASFLSSLNGELPYNGAAILGQATMNSISPMDSTQNIQVLPELSAEKSGDVGVDIFARNVGQKTLRKGERSLFVVDKKTVPYEKIVRWDIGDSRYDNGRATNSGGSDSGASSYGRTSTGVSQGTPTFTEPWDVLIFRNPFDYPLTTGPAFVYSSNRFLGQNTLFWRNPGERTLLPVTKALGVRVRSLENERVLEDENDNQVANSSKQDLLNLELKPDLWGKAITVDMAFYRFAVIDTTIELNNLRDEETVVEISRRFYGLAIPDSFVGFEKIPEIIRTNPSLVSNYLTRFNPCSETSWRTTLKPFEKKVLKFSYQILLDR